MKRVLTILMSLFVLAGIGMGNAVAQDVPDDQEVFEPEPLGINIDMGLSSMYVWRGLNVFQDGSQQDHNGLFAPGITWSIFDTGLAVGYWGAYQLNGGSAKANVDGGAGHEQDLYITYEKGFMDDLLTMGLGFTYYFYPFADEDVAGSSVPSYIEPAASLTISKYVDFSMNIYYFMGVNKAAEGGSHLYLQPYLSKSLTLGDRYGMDLGLGFGYKMFTGPDATIGEGDNRFDVAFDVALPIQVTDVFYISPAIHAGWTNIKRIAVLDDASTPLVDESGDARATVGDEFFVYGSVNVGADF